MADDARISVALPRHPKTVKLHRRLGTAGCWHLVCLFLWVAESHYDGNLKDMTDEDIEIAAGWNSETGAFVRALVEVGFLDGNEGSRSIHDWLEHNPWVASRGKRIQAAKLAAGIRWQGKQAANGMRGACEAHGSAMPTTQPHLTNKSSLSELNPSSDEVASLTGEKSQTHSSKEAFQLARLLKAEILRNKPDYRITPAQERRWAVTADRMIRLDGRNPQDIAELIRWAQRDEFWMSNILSLDKLRLKFDALQLKARGPRRPMRIGRALDGPELPREQYQVPSGLDELAGQKLWNDVLGKLQARINVHSFQTWLRPLKAAGLRDGVLFLKLPTSDFRYVETKYSAQIIELLGEQFKIQYLTPRSAA